MCNNLFTRLSPDFPAYIITVHDSAQNAPYGICMQFTYQLNSVRTDAFRKRVSRSNPAR